MKRKILFALLASIVFVVGCGGESTDNTNTTDTTEDTTAETDSTVAVSEEDITGTLVVWEHSTTFDEPMESVIEGFQELYPDVKFEYESKDGEYYSLLATAMQSGDGPDIFWTHGTSTPIMADYVNNNLIYDLTNDVDFSLFNDMTMKISEINRSYYSVPWLNMDTRAVYYNKDHFSENGWSVPETFDEFETLLQSSKDAGYIPVSLAGMDEGSLLFAFELLLAGYDPVYTNALADYSVGAADAPVGEMIDLMKAWGDKGYFGENWIGVNYTGQTLAFTSEKASMMIAGSWSTTGIQENNPALNFGAFIVPANDGSTGLVGTPANGFSVNAESKNLPAALAFAKYCASLDGQTRFVQTMGGVSASDKIEASNEIAKEISQSGGGNTYTSWQSVLANHSEEGIAASIYEQELPDTFSGDITTEDFLSHIDEVME